MLFSSMTFVYMFLPIVCTLYLIAKKELHNPILLIASIIFYAWGEPKYLAIMLLTILVNFFGAKIVEKFKECGKNAKIPLVITICANLGFLIYFKYFNFLIENINGLFHSHIHLLHIIMPIGISFYTFQALSYVVDVYRGECKAQQDIYKLALYICLFPQLIAGPIVKYHDVADQIDNRDVNFEKVVLGTKRFIVGLSKKMLLANTIGAIADKIFAQAPDTFSPLVAWVGGVAYSLQLFFDFSGYSDMAIGLGLIFGFKFLENFNYPYISKSITEFWRRWHISLSTWFKQYVYITLGGNRSGKLTTLRNLGIVFLLTGIWHGAAWNFVVWGLWNGFFIILEKLTGWHEEKQHVWQKVLQHIYTILVFIIGWVMFRADNMVYAWEYIKNMFGLVKVHDVVYAMPYYVDNFEIIIFVAAFICCTPLCGRMLQQENKIAKTFVDLWLIVLLIFSTATIAASTYNPFIYFRF
ncbi:MAG: MBOAT family protein [Fusobacterium sp.]|nr:MBOAT family protein [Fusobacterium sp.]